MASATGWSFPEESMSCGICLQPFVRPTVLTCGHTFCEECLKEAAKGGLRCPTCRRPVSLPPGGVSGLPKNYQVEELCQKFSELTASHDDAPQWDVACEHHPSEMLRLFCQTCEVPICNQCLDETSHRGHKNVITVKQAVKNRMATVMPLLKVKRRQMEQRREYLEEINHLEERVTNEKLQSEQAITDSYETMVQLLTENKEERLASVRERYELNMEIVNDRKDEVQRQLEGISAVCEEVEQTIEKAGIRFLSDEPGELRSKMEQINEDPLPDPLKIRATVFRPEETKREKLAIGHLESRDFVMESPWKNGLLYKLLSSVGSMCSYGKDTQEEEGTRLRS